MRRPPGRSLVLLATTLALWPRLASAVDSLAVVPLRVAGDGEVRVDGVLDESVWAEAFELGDFTRIEPVNVGPPAHATRVRLFYSETALYIGVECEVPRADVHVARTPRDSGPAGDWVAVALDTFGDAQRAYRFTVSAAGSQIDERVVQGRVSDRTWDTTFDSDVVIADEGFVVEMRIPFRDLRFSDRDAHRWGLQIERGLWRAQETGAWAPIDPDAQNTLAQYGHLALESIEPSASVQILPSLTFAWADTADDPAECDYDADVGSFTVCGVEGAYGLGVRYLIGPALVADAVFNPDFSQVEADPGQLTINNRFALFLDERRPFFLENRDVFELPQSLVYTRSINRPLAGARLTGSVAERTRIGLLVAHDVEPPDSVLDTGFAPPRDDGGESLVNATTSVVRLEQDVLASSRVGMVLASREYSGDGRAFSRLGGVDARFELGPSWTLTSLLVGSWSEDLEGNERADVGSDISAVWSVESWRLQLQDVWIGDDLRAEMGFLPRVGYHHVRVKFDHYHRSDRPGFRWISPGVQGRVYFDAKTHELQEAIATANTYWDFGGRTWFFVEGDTIYEVFEGRSFQYSNLYLSAGSGYLPAFAPDVFVELGDAILRDDDYWVRGVPVEGSQVEAGVTVSSRPTTAVDLSTQFTTRSLYAGVFGERLESQRIARFRATYLFTNAWNLRFITEHRHPDDEISFDTLLTYLPSPGTLLFVGYRDVQSIADDWTLVSRGFFIKLSYLWSI